jgi:hypothetical protein
MKVVINGGYGGFNLSDAAVERCLELGMKLTAVCPEGGYVDSTADFVKCDDSPWREHYYILEEYERRNAFRSHPLLVQAVEELGDNANGEGCKLKIVDIPFESTEGWHIEEFDGLEEVAEDHRRWL